MEQNEALIRRWFEELWNQKRVETIDELFAPDGVSYGMLEDGVATHGAEHWKQVHASFCAAIPDLHIEVCHVIAGGDHVAVRFTATGTNTGPFQGIPASNNPIKIEGMCTGLIRDGKLVEGRNVLDMLGLLQQIGASPKIAEIAAAKRLEATSVE
ncbi:MAG: ester cyclase [Capsulimonas sp.]|uniref:ester cyclase n=1 Tax=Capsulimonas sp. TaxID=2494211 RepID=UPI0032639F33